MNFTHPTLTQIPGREVMQISHLHTGTLKDVHFSLHEGEIIGIAGLTTFERTMLIEAIQGQKKVTSGSIKFSNSEKRPVINLVTSLEADKALFMSQTVPFNITASNFKKNLRFGFVSLKEMQIYAAQYLNKLKMQNITTDTKLKHLCLMWMEILLPKFFSNMRPFSLLKNLLNSGRWIGGTAYATRQSFLMIPGIKQLEMEILQNVTQFSSSCG